MNDATPDHGLSVHRSEALTDGIYAVAMTLLVIELKLPMPAGSAGAGADHHELAAALLALVPKLYAWVLSFFVLAIFWVGHHRAYAGVRRADGRLLALNLAQLAFVSLMPFACAVLGEHGTLLAQVVYALNMVALAVCALLTLAHVHRHPELSAVPLGQGLYDGARIRIGGLIVISVLTVVIQALLDNPGIGNIAFALMAVIVPLSRRAERAGASGARLTVTP